MLPGAGRHIAIVSVWLIGEFPYGFDPKLAPWFATCKDAIRDVRGKLEEQRRFFDCCLRFALRNLRVHCEFNVRTVAIPIIWRGSERLAWLDDIDVTEEDRGAVRMMHWMAGMIAQRAEINMRERLALLRDLRTEVELYDLQPDGNPVVQRALELWDQFLRQL